IAVADVAQGIPPWDTNLGRPIALVIGSEHEGISPTWLEAADLRLRLPMRGQTDSLNASATAAILLYEATRQRSSPEGA
ncbi:MAG: TrmH family RNA methyltransferase, partial [Acidimicrobiia bacterium]